MGNPIRLCRSWASRERTRWSEEDLQVDAQVPVEVRARDGRVKRDSMSSIPLNDVRSSTSARFLHEEPITPIVDELTALEHELSFHGTDVGTKSVHPLWRRHVFAALERPESSLHAFVLHGEDGVYHIAEDY
jgi:hypothetical protein